jgi:nucleotide-binding universal stress UspA family protein
MSDAGLSLRHVLAVAAHDGDAETLQAAAELAGRHGAKLTVMACLERPTDLSVLARAVGMEPEEMLARMEEARLAELAEAVRKALPGREAEVHVAAGKAFVEIVRQVIATDVDMVVKAAEPLGGMHRYLFASTDQHLVRKCPCPVWLRLPGARAAPTTVLAAVDVDEWDAGEPETLAALNRRVIDAAIGLAAGPDASVHVLHAWEAIGEGLVWTFSTGTDARAAAETYVEEVRATRKRALDALVRPFRRETGPRVAPHLARGPARSVISEEAQALGADVIVMGTVARTGLSGVIIGNTAEDILNSVECSVLTVKPEGFVSPIDADVQQPHDG